MSNQATLAKVQAVDSTVVRLSSRDIVDSISGQRVASNLRSMIETQCREELQDAGKPNPPRVEVDFANVATVSSASLGGLIQVNREARGLEVPLVLVNVCESVRDILTITRLDRMFLVADAPKVSKASI